MNKKQVIKWIERRLPENFSYNAYTIGNAEYQWMISKKYKE